MIMMRKSQSRAHFIGGLLFMLVIGLILYEGVSRLVTSLQSDDALPVKAVKIDGAFSQLSRRYIAELAGKVAGGRNIASLDTAVLERRLYEEPWVAQAVVERQMPDTLLISVVEHVPAAYWNERGLYDARTKTVFYPDLKNFSQSLVKLGAFRDNLAPEVYKNAVAFIKILSESSYQMVELYMDQVRCYNLTLSNGTRLILGQDPEVCEERLRRFLQAFPETGLKIDEVAYADLRYDVGFAIGRGAGSGDRTGGKQ